MNCLLVTNLILQSRPDIIAKLHKELTKRIQTAKELAAENDHDDGKENNVENVATGKPLDDTPLETVTKEEVGGGATSPKKRLSSSS